MIVPALLALVVLLPDGVSGQVSARAYLSPGSTVGVGRQFLLNVEVTGAQALDQQPDLPDLSFAQFLGSSQQSSVRVVNGLTSITLTVQYRFQAIAEGAFEIPSFEVRAGGERLRTTPLELEVTAAAPPPGGGAQDGGVSSDDLFVTAQTTKTRVVDGEPFIVEYRIWTRVDVSSFTLTRATEPQEFRV